MSLPPTHTLPVSLLSPSPSCRVSFPSNLLTCLRAYLTRCPAYEPGARGLLPPGARPTFATFRVQGDCKEDTSYKERGYRLLTPEPLFQKGSPRHKAHLQFLKRGLRIYLCKILPCTPSNLYSEKQNSHKVNNRQGEAWNQDRCFGGKSTWSLLYFI